jgi:hypothetical protein
MRTVITLETEWRQVLRGSVSTGAKKMSQVLGTFELLDFTMLRTVLALRVYKLMNHIFV